MTPPRSVGITSVEEADPSEWLLLQLAIEVEGLLGRGLRRGYVETQGLLPHVRGRARVPTNPAQLPKLYCEYAEFTSDTKTNQLIKAALLVLTPSVQNKVVRRMLTSALAALADVSVVRPNIEDYSKTSFSRLDEHYASAINLARLALEGAGIVDFSGGQTAPSLFVPMWKVWEKAFTSALREFRGFQVVEQPEYANLISQVSGLPEVSVVIKPDIVIGPRRNPQVVVDLKWASALELRHGKLRLQNQHIYQIAAYARALASPAFLVYPQYDTPVTSSYEIDGQVIYIRTVDLGAGNLSDLRSVAAEVVGVALKDG
jgi:5-methylcytosine-specific restriction enzyme subunit McrC